MSYISLRKKYSRKLSTVFILLFFSVPLVAQEEGGSYSGTITHIEVIGLRRTRPHIADFSLEKFLGREGASLDHNEVYAAVRETGILEMLSVELIEITEGLLLRVIVEERWAFFPLPMFFAGSGEYAFGLFLMDANAFGQRDQMALGAMYGSGGLSGMAMYNHTPNRRGLPGWNTFFMYGRLENEDLDRDENIHRRYTTDQLRISLGLNYNFTDLFSGSTSFSFSNISLVENDNFLSPPENGAMLLTISPGLSMRSSSWDGFFLSQRSLSLGYSYNYAISGSSYHQAEFRSIYQHSLVPGFRLNMRGGGVWKSTSEPLFEEGPQKAQVTILPRGFSARNYAGYSTGLEKHLFSFRWGTLSIHGEWQSVFSYGSISDFEINSGLAGGLSFYLRRLAIPAIGGGIAYNMNSGLYQASFSIGMSF